jgi:hypothetical protein
MGFGFGGLFFCRRNINGSNTVNSPNRSKGADGKKTSAAKAKPDSLL